MADVSERDFFYRLTPDEIIDAVVKLGLEPSGHVAQLNSMENRVFDLRLDDGRHVVTKFYRPGRWSEAQIREEHRFLAELSEHEIPVLAPLAFGGETLFAEQGIFFALWARTGGREPEEFTEIDLQILGRLLARLHNIGAGVAYAARPALSGERYLTEPLAVLTEKKYLPPKFEDAYRALAEIVRENFMREIADVPLLRLHGDLHKGNMLNGSEGWFLLDFDDSLTGPAVQDLWMMFPGSSGESLRARETFLAAYREFRDFDDRWLSLAEILRAMRIIHYSGWIARRYDDPAFKSAFPSFADDAYWEEEIGVLRDICADLGGQSALPGDDEQLGNKDFFFDWEDK